MEGVWKDGKLPFICSAMGTGKSTAFPYYWSKLLKYRNDNTQIILVATGIALAKNIFESLKSFLTTRRDDDVTTIGFRY